MSAEVHRRAVILSSAGSLADSLPRPGRDEGEGLCPIPFAVALRAAAPVSRLLGSTAPAGRLRLRLGRRLSDAASVRPSEPPRALHLRLLLRPLLSSALKRGAVPLVPFLEVRVDTGRENEFSARIRTRRNLCHDRVRRVANTPRAGPVTTGRTLLVRCRCVANRLERGRRRPQRSRQRQHVPESAASPAHVEVHVQRAEGPV